MKRMLALILAVLLTAALCGCGSDPAPSTSGSSSTPVAAPAGSESGSKDNAIVAVCGYGVGDTPLADAFAALYNDGFQGILMQNYRAKYAELTPASTETTLADGTPALRFEDVQPADDYGTGLNCPVYGYGFLVGDVPFIVAYIVMDEAAADDAKCAEMKGYVDEMVNTVRAAQ